MTELVIALLEELKEESKGIMFFLQNECRNDKNSEKEIVFALINYYKGRTQGLQLAQAIIQSEGENNE